MSGHAAGDRMDRVLHVDASLLEHVLQLAGSVLGLRHGKAVAGDDDHALRVGEQGAEILGRRRADASRRASRAARGRGGDRVHLAEGSEEHVGQRAAHGVAHHLGQQATRGPDQRPRHDEREVVQREAARGHGKAGERVQQRDDHRHVGAADGQHERHAKDEREHHQSDEGEGDRGDRQHGDGKADHRRRQQRVHDLLRGIGDGRAGHQLLQLGERDHAARERDRADCDAEHAGQRFGQGRMRAELQQLGNRDQRRRAAADPVEEGDHLRDRGHFHHARADGSDHRADHHPDGDALQAGLREVQQRDGGAERDHHSGRGREVSVARSLR